MTAIIRDRGSYNVRVHNKQDSIRVKENKLKPAKYNYLKATKKCIPSIKGIYNTKQECEAAHPDQQDDDWNLDDVNNLRVAPGEDPNCNAWQYWLAQNLQPIDCLNLPRRDQANIHPDKNKSCDRTATKIFQMYQNRAHPFCQ